MLFLMRLAFWLLLIVLLLPSTHDDNRRLINSASRTVDDVRGFCGRNPDVCETARLVAAALLHKAQNGAEMVSIWIGGGGNGEPPAKDGARLAPAHEAAPASPLRTLIPKAVWRDTLDEADRRAPWQGPAPDRVNARLPES
jgi:hypothetical protein